MHNICEGKTFSYGEVPWHGIGKILDKPATAKEAIEAADLGYQVEKRKIYVRDEGLGVLSEVPEKYATVRVDSGKALGVVGERYKIVQNVEAFDFFDKVVGEGQAIYHTAGALGQGERIWILAKLPKDTLIFKEDVIEKYICLTNSHDGGSALKVYPTPIRVVCQNTLNASLRNAGDGIAIRHTGKLETKIAEAQRVLGLTLDFYGAFDEAVEALAEKSVTVKEVEGFVNRVLKIEGKDTKDLSTKVKNQRDVILQLFDKEGRQIPAIKGTAWAAYNAVTGWIDHYQTVKGSTEDKTNRLKSIWFGNGASVKEAAFQEALALAVK